MQDTKQDGSFVYFSQSSTFFPRPKNLFFIPVNSNNTIKPYCTFKFQLPNTLVIWKKKKSKHNFNTFNGLLSKVINLIFHNSSPFSEHQNLNSQPPKPNKFSNTKIHLFTKNLHKVKFQIRNISRRKVRMRGYFESKTNRLKSKVKNLRLLTERWLFDCQNNRGIDSWCQMTFIDIGLFFALDGNSRWRQTSRRDCHMASARTAAVSNLKKPKKARAFARELYGPTRNEPAACF